MKKIVFFDRDDTLIKDVPYLNDPNKIEFFDDTISTLKALKAKGYEFIIVTNQSGIARGLVTDEQLQSIHERLLVLLAEQGVSILKIYHSPYLPESNHPTRKPNPGMIEQAYTDYIIDKNNSYMVGDKPSDAEAGIKAGLKSFLLNKKLPEATTIYSLKELLDHI